MPRNDRLSSMGKFSVEAKTKKISVDQNLPLKYYYRSADNALRQATVYRSEGNLVELYVLLLRFSSLVTETIPDHKEYGSGSFAQEKQDFKRSLLSVLDELERLKPRVKGLVEEINGRRAPPGSLAPPPGAPSAPQLPPDFGLSWPPALPRTGGSNGAPYPSSFSTPSPYSLDGLDLLTGPLGDSGRSSAGAAASTSGAIDSFRSTSFAIPPARAETRSRHSILGPLGPQPRQLPLPARVQYPNLIDASPVDIPGLGPDGWHIPAALPAPPAQQGAPGGAELEQLDIAPEVRLIRQPTPPPVEVPVQTMPAPAEAPQPRPEDVADPRPGPSGNLESALAETKGPKPLHVSAKMMEEFMRLVSQNTARNLETCGVLAGNLKHGKFYVTTLILPKQQATSDSCQTLNEEEIFDAQDKRGLFQLGWIHTHPSQSCFMSSIDLHTHYSYQIMLQEAIAIVMAPSDRSKRFGVFRLAEPGGVKVIQQCQKRGFHPHETPPDGGPIYQHCAHVYLDPNVAFDVIDLRSI